MHDNAIVAPGRARDFDATTASPSLERVCLFSLLGIASPSATPLERAMRQDRPSPTIFLAIAISPI